MILYGDDRYLLKSKLWAFTYRSGSKSTKVVSLLALWYSLYPVWLIMRIFRLDLTGAFCNEHGFGFFCLGKLHFYNLEEEEWKIKQAFNCKRPLKVDFDDKYLYFGDYTSNRNRREKIGVYKYSFSDNRLIEIYSYGDVRHVHSVKILAGEQILILCGDYGEEARMTLLDKQGDKKFELKNKNNDQLVRAVDCIYVGSNLYYGTDTQIEQNYLCRYSFETGQIEQLEQLEGPIFNIWLLSSDVIGFTVSCEVGLNNIDTISIYSYNVKSSELRLLYSYRIPIKLNKFLQTLFGIPGFEVYQRDDKLIVNNNYYLNCFRRQFSISLS